MEEEFRLLGCLHLKRERMGYRCEKRGDYYSLLHFINPVDITLDGKEFKTGSNACVIYTPGAYRRFSRERLLFPTPAFIMNFALTF